MGLAVSTVQKIWHAHGLAPHRLLVFKHSRDPEFAALSIGAGWVAGAAAVLIGLDRGRRL